MTKPKPKSEHAPKGRPPTPYKPEYAHQVRHLVKMGASDSELCDFLGISITLLWKWRAKYPTFHEALKIGKDEADLRVVNSLYGRAIGYTHDDVQIFPPTKDRPLTVVPYRKHVPPDVVACIFWLKNRQPAQWRDKIDHALGLTNAEGKELGDDERMNMLALFLARAQKDKGMKLIDLEPEPPARKEKA